MNFLHLLLNQYCFFKLFHLTIENLSAKTHAKQVLGGEISLRDEYDETLGATSSKRLSTPHRANQTVQVDEEICGF